MVALDGKITSEIGVHATAAKWFNLFAKQLHDVQHIAGDRVHGTKLHEGEDWHHPETIKHWTYTIDGKVTTCHEKIEDVDEKNKKIVYKLFGENIDPSYKDFKFIFEAIEKTDGAIIKWTVHYERVNDDVDPPYGYVEYLHKVTKDIDDNLLKA